MCLQVTATTIRDSTAVMRRMFVREIISVAYKNASAGCFNFTADLFPGRTLCR